MKTPPDLWGLGLGLAVFLYLDFIAQVIGLLFFDTPVLRTVLAGFVGLVFGSSLLRSALRARKVKLARENAQRP